MSWFWLKKIGWLIKEYYYHDIKTYTTLKMLKMSGKQKCVSKYLKEIYMQLVKNNHFFSSIDKYRLKRKFRVWRGCATVETSSFVPMIMQSHFCIAVWSSTGTGSESGSRGWDESWWNSWIAVSNSLIGLNKFLMTELGSGPVVY